MNAMDGYPPEGEGRRMRTFGVAFQQALKAVTAECTFRDFKQFFPALTSEQNELLADLHSQVMKILRVNAQAEFDDICRENQVCLKLNDLERLCADQGIVDGEATSISVPPAVVMPSTATQADRVKAKEEEKRMLQSLLDQAEKENAEASGALDARRREVASKTAELKSIGDALGGVFTASKQWANRDTPMFSGAAANH